MTTHAEMVEGVRNLHAEMILEVQRFREAIPTGAFVLANAATKLLGCDQYGEAADYARAVIQALRRVPRGAVQLSERETEILLAMVAESAAVTRELLKVMRTADNAKEIAGEIQEHADLSELLDGLTRKLDGGRAIYVVPEKAQERVS